VVGGAPPGAGAEVAHVRVETGVEDRGDLARTVESVVEDRRRHPGAETGLTDPNRSVVDQRAPPASIDPEDVVPLGERRHPRAQLFRTREQHDATERPAAT
jgi:hypothetical protein